ncbi:MAG: sigma 54-interacting transcriptional regulator [Polyangiaceae bacterium]|nr:sigma 54-interacting transcriptional regulator [Polyangiaceae bacterium]
MTPPKPPQTEEHAGPAGPSERARVSHLLVAHPLAAVLPWRLGVFGRADAEAVGVRDARLSGQHFTLSGHGGVPHVADAGSRNGTFVDGRRLGPTERVPLQDGTVVRAGTTLLVHRLASPGLSPEPPLGALAGPFGLAATRRALEHAVLRRAENVLIVGESGTGKDLVAQHLGARLGRSVVAVNVSAIPATLAESTLFGHEAGAYSDAKKQGSRGLVGDAEGGVLFLDELGELPLELQPKLLRLLENRAAQSVGGRERRVELVVVAATNRDLEAAVEAGRFRRDLVERFAHRVALPALHERPEDVPTLVRATLAFGGLPLDPAATEVEALEHLMLRVFPGNLRTLRRALEDAAAGTRDSRLTLEGVRRAGLAERATGALTAARVAEALAASGGNESAAADALGVSRGMLLRAKKRG